MQSVKLSKRQALQLAELASTFYGGWRVSLEPFRLESSQLEELTTLGEVLCPFLKSCNRLYYQSLRGIQPRWIAEYLDLGKPDFILSLGRMNRFQQALHRVIRPDLILTDKGFSAVEFDLVPGGIGLMTQFQQLYEMGSGMLTAFSHLLQEESALEYPRTAIVITDQASAYKPEMEEISWRLRQRGFSIWVVTPEELSYQDQGVFYRGHRLDLLYRFFEIYELEAMPNREALLSAIKHRRIKITPAIKPQLEEKIWFALFHHPILRGFWIHELGETAFKFLERLFPKAWILDPREIPPTATVPGLEIQDQPVQDWTPLRRLSQKERSQWVLKPSGYSRLSWGAKGVRVGEDLSHEDWQKALEEALGSFQRGPWILQRWAHPVRQKFDWVGLDGKRQALEVRARISPFYFISFGTAKLAGVLATLCGLDKKIIHGMPGAILAPAV